MASRAHGLERDAERQRRRGSEMRHARDVTNGQDRHPDAGEGVRSKIKREPEHGTSWGHNGRRDFSPYGPSVSSRGRKADLDSHWNLRDPSVAAGGRRRSGIAGSRAANVAIHGRAKKSRSLAHAGSEEPRARFDSSRKIIPPQGTADRRVHGTVAIRIRRRGVADVRERNPGWALAIDVYLLSSAPGARSADGACPQSPVRLRCR